MNGKEAKILVEVANDIKWIKDKQQDHDERLADIDFTLKKGTGKIAENRGRIDILQKLTFTVIVGGALGIAGWVISALIRTR